MAQPLRSDPETTLTCFSREITRGRVRSNWPCFRCAISRYPRPS